MSQSTQTFKAADLSKQFKAACIQFDTLLASANSKELTKIRQKFRDGLQDYKQQGALTVAFIGQYSAGKSTIISALTGRRDIHIDADIATDATTPYDWNGIKIIDTPGLFTDRTDHDDITYEAIAKADLLVFCLTHMLFDTLTVENFKKLAYDKGYRWKIMLVVNKMSAAAGEEEQKIASYRHSLDEALKPYSLNEFPICFIDAKDYCEGIDDDDDFLVEISRFDTFITELNRFVEHRSSLTRLDTPVRIALGCLDDAQISFARNSDEDTAFLEVLSRLSRRINKERERLRTKIKGITLEMSAAIAAEGSRLASSVGDPKFEDLDKQSEINVRKHYEKAGQALEDAIENAIQSIHLEVEAELQSNLTQAFVAQLNFNGKVPDQSSVNNFNRQQVQGQVAWLQKIGDQVGANITKAATREFAATAGQGFLRSIDVAGSRLHQGVYSVGKLIGFKFKPWQAVGIAKNIGNAALFLGPALAVVSIGLDLHSMHKEREYEKQMSDVRRDITSQFKIIAVDLEQQIESQLQEFESQVYVQLENNIAEARQKTESEMATSHTEIGQVVAIRKELEAIILEIQHAAASAVL
ncbi:GTPase [Thermoleptolyngbya oregonensis NK1-22]|uniref:GTPase n=1 Tax=Thermoleptolyngbya oregonensis NK1-22 TaxID=2547457 RepID=A0AA97BMH9_9CYAN|nr:GTPase [Thermoleptolyngbya oregonensis NK1-22]